MYPPNISIIKHTINKRQGGARNTAIKHSKGLYVTCIDQDDYYLPNSITAIIKTIKNNHGIDMIMSDYAIANQNCELKASGFFISNKRSITTGTKYLQTQNISWMPWGYTYRRQFINDHHLRFEENVRFEDVDFVLECIARSKSILYLPFNTICHRETEIQTSAVGNSIEKNTDLIKIAHRVGEVAYRLKQEENKAWDIVMAHHKFMYLSVLKRNIWRLPCKTIYYSLREYPIVTSDSTNLILYTLREHTKTATFIICLAKPILKITYNLYKLIK